MRLVKLSVGHFSEGETVEAEGHIDKPVMLVYSGKFQSMDGEVEITDEHIEKLAQNHNSFLSKFKRLAGGEIPAKAQPPIQLDHSPSATMTVGRLIGELTAGDYDDDGVKKRALFGKLRVLGKENVEKVKDGRWTHVSIGADLDDGKLNELSITPFPAAPNASLLSKGKQGDGKMAMTPEEKAKCKKHLMEHKKMSEEDADKHLAKCEEDAEEHKKLAAEVDEHCKKMAADEEEKKKLAAEEDDKKKAKMAANREQFKKLSGELSVKLSETRLAAKQAKLTARLTVLRASAKLTPAEQKKIDVKELAGKSDDAIEMFFKGFEDREPVIPLGQLGTKKAADLARLTQQAQKTQLTAETVGNMPFLKAALEKQKKLADGTVIEIEPAATHEKEQGLAADYMKKFMEKHEELMNKGDREGLNKHLAEHAEHMSRHMTGLSEEAPVAQDHEKHMAGLAESMEKLQNDFQTLVTLASETLEA
jgi:hypothetical protein